MPQPATAYQEVLNVTLPPGRQLTETDWRRVESYLDEWADKLRAAAKRHPARSFELGYEQISSYLDLIGKLGALGFAEPPVALSQTQALAWLKRSTLAEIEGVIAKYKDEIRTALLHGVEGNVNPTQLGGWLYNLTKDASVNWRLVARTEMVRANAMGRLQACADQGYEQVWVPPHVGACASCKKLLENQVFPIEQVMNASNYGKPQAEWVACIPLHPQCRHSYLPYDAEVFEIAQEQYANVRDAFAPIDLRTKSGKPMSVDQKITEMFDSSGHLKPEYQDSMDWNRFKTHDPFEHALGETIAKVHVAKGFFDPEQHGYDPLLFDGEELRTDVRERIVEWWRHALGPDAPLWSHVFITGGATSPQYLTPGIAEKDPDLDLQVIVDYPELRAHRPQYAVLSDPELHAALVTQLKAALDGMDIAPGLRLDAFIRPETTVGDFRADVALAGQDVWDVAANEWFYRHPLDEEAEVVAEGVPIMEGVGGEVALEHPEWVEEAQRTRDLIGVLLEAHESGSVPDEDLAQAYRMLHDARAASFRPGGGGNTGHGNFLWQYLVNFGRLMQLKHAVEPTGLEKLMPEYRWAPPAPDAWTVEKRWPLPAGTLVTVGGEVEIITERAGVGLYKTFDGEDLAHIAIEMVAKEAPDAAANEGAWQPGVEHWITVHPNGPEEKGIPVLVRNGASKADGMVVIGGAGGHLRYLRIHPGRRVKEPAEGNGELKANGPSEEPISEAEAQQQAEEHEQRVEEASKVIDQAAEQTKLINSQLHDYLGGIGVNLETKHVTHLDPTGEVVDEEDLPLSAKEKKKLLKAVFDSALHVNSYGELSSADAADGYEMKSVVKEKPTEEPGDDEEPAAPERPSDERPEDEEPQGKTVEHKAKVALTADQAEAILQLRKRLQKIGQAKRKANQIIAGQASAPDAFALDWSDSDISEAVAKEATERQRTDIARELMMTGEEALHDQAGGARSERSPIRRALRQGAYDTMDAVSEAVLGRSVIPPKVSRLLGVAGTAQLLAHHLRQQANAGKLDLDKVLDTMNEMTDERETTVLSRALTRAKAATEEAVQMRAERKLSEKGESDYTETSAKSREVLKMNEAAAALGYSIAGQEAFSAMKVALGRDSDMMRVQGFASPSQIMELADKAGLEVTAKDIAKQGAGSYSLTVDPSKLEHLFEIKPRPDEAQRATLQQIREADDDSKMVEDARDTPGMSQTLKPSQARGKLALLQMGSGILAMDPGVGKTHTAIAAAMELMHSEPDKHHRVLVIAPDTALLPWADTISKQGSGKSVQIMGNKYEWDPEGGEDRGGEGKRSGSGSSARAAKQVGAPADFNVVSFEMMAAQPEMMKKLGHTIVVFDEAQKLKNQETSRFKQAHEVAAQAGHRWMLSGTTVEKRVGDIQSQLAFVNPGVEGQKGFQERYGSTGQHEHIAREEKVSEFRESELDPYVFHVSAASGSKLPGSNLHPDGLPDELPVKLGAKHKAAFREAVAYVNAEQRRRRAAGEKPMPFGGQDYLASALRTGHDPEEGNALARSTVDQIEKEGTFDYEDKDFGGQHSGSYAHKHVVFDKYVNGTKPLQEEFDKRGYERWKPGAKLDPAKRYYFMANSSEPNEEAIQAFLAHQGKGVLLSTDKNSTARSFQFGVNNGRFQHGATRMIHYSLPDNPAEVHQRQARIYRNGARVPVTFHSVSAGLPHEIKQRERLEGENRIQGLIGNSEAMVPDLPAPRGHEPVKGEQASGQTPTLRQRLRRRGQQTVAEQEE